MSQESDVTNQVYEFIFAITGLNCFMRRETVTVIQIRATSHIRFQVPYTAHFLHDFTPV